MISSDKDDDDINGDYENFLLSKQILFPPRQRWWFLELFLIKQIFICSFALLAVYVWTNSNEDDDDEKNNDEDDANDFGDDKNNEDDHDADDVGRGEPYPRRQVPAGRVLQPGPHLPGLSSHGQVHI